VLLIAMEHMTFGTNHVAQLLGGGFNQLLHLAYHLDDHDTSGIGALGDTPNNPESDVQNLRFTMQMLSPLPLLGSARLWGGLVAAASMILLTIRLRRYSDDS
jgi:hypothetical protein